MQIGEPLMTKGILAFLIHFCLDQTSIVQSIKYIFFYCVFKWTRVTLDDKEVSLILKP